MAPFGNTEERERPAEWLRRFDEDGRRYGQLLRETESSLAVAAYRLAKARCRVQPQSSPVPTDTELWAAAGRIAARTGAGPVLMSKTLLTAECEHHGLVVIGPSRR